MAKRDILVKEIREKASKLSLQEIKLMIEYGDCLLLIEAKPEEKDTLMKEFREKAIKYDARFEHFYFFPDEP